jgi:WhiB family redox-sensing transcriptional regulator
MTTATLRRAYQPLDANWRLLGLCLTEDPNLMHPADRDLYGQNQAKAVCENCPVKAKCLKDAIDTDDWNGIRGGMTPRERRAYHSKPIRQRNRSGLTDHHQTIADMLDRPTPATWAQIGAAVGWNGGAVKKYWQRQQAAAQRQEQELAA